MFSAGQTLSIGLRWVVFCRYLAVRLGLNVAVVKDVFGQHERTALDRVQPASLTHHYKFAAHSRHLSDARPEDADVVRSGPPCVMSCAPPQLACAPSGVCYCNNRHQTTVLCCLVLSSLTFA